MDYAYDLYLSAIVVSALFLFVALIKVTAFLGLSLRHHQSHRRLHPKVFTDGLPFVSVIIPSYNEDLTLENCVNGLLNQAYGNYEILIVNDGSTDDTWQVARRLAEVHPQIRAFSKPNGGKASALNYGIQRAHGTIVVCIDADSIFIKDTLYQLALSFEDPEVMAVGGNVRVANRKRLLNKHQALEYITGLTLQRRAFAHLGCMQVISGAIGAFRRSKLLEIGGYSSDTIVEDMDITVELARRGSKVIYNPLAIAYTEAPESLRDFLKQRYRWTYGGFQVIEKHRDILFRRHFNKLGTIGLPYFAIFPWMDVAVSSMLFLAIGRAIATRDGVGAVSFFLALTMLQASLVIYALSIDKESKRLALLSGIDNLFYNQLISYVTVWAGINFALKRKVSWNKLKRYGKNTAPA